MSVKMPGFPMLIETIGAYDPDEALLRSEAVHLDICKDIAAGFDDAPAGDISPLQTLVFTTEAPVDRGAPSTHTIVRLALLEVNGSIKDVYDRMVRGLCKQTKAAMVAWASEVWHVHCQSDEDRAEMLAWQEAHDGSLEGFRLSSERLLCGLEVRGKGTRVMAASITRDEQGSRRLGPWKLDETLSDPGLALEGRFVRILEEVPP